MNTSRKIGKNHTHVEWIERNRNMRAAIPSCVQNCKDAKTVDFKPMHTNCDFLPVALLYIFFKFKLEKKRKFKSRAHFLWFFLQCGVFIKLSSLIFISLHLTRKLYFKEEILSDSSGNLMNATGWWICKCISHVSSWICILFAIWMQMRSRTANW